VLPLERTRSASLILLPGMDGTGRLFRPLIAALPSSVTAAPVGFPDDRPLGYEALLADLKLPQEPFVLVAESFSGPLALMAAAQRPPQLKAVVLVATFATSPLRLGPLVAPLVGRWLFLGPPPAWRVRRYLLGDDATNGEVDAVRQATTQPTPEVMASRLREILRVDVEGLLKDCLVPVTYLRGTKDRLVPARMARRMKALLPSMTVVDVDAPHLVVQTNPRASADAILRALRELTDSLAANQKIP